MRIASLLVEMGNSGFDILVHPEECVQCLICQLRCSLRLTGLFNPARSAIVIHGFRDRPGATITFTEACDSCGICARHCPYGALELERKAGEGHESE